MLPNAPWKSRPSKDTTSTNISSAAARRRARIQERVDKPSDECKAQSDDTSASKSGAVSDQCHSGLSPVNTGRHGGVVPERCQAGAESFTAPCTTGPGWHTPPLPNSVNVAKKAKNSEGRKELWETRGKLGRGNSHGNSCHANTSHTLTNHITSQASTKALSDSKMRHSHNVPEKSGGRSSQTNDRGLTETKSVSECGSVERGKQPAEQSVNVLQLLHGYNSLQDEHTQLSGTDRQSTILETKTQSANRVSNWLKHLSDGMAGSDECGAVSSVATSAVSAVSNVTDKVSTEDTIMDFGAVNPKPSQVLDAVKTGQSVSDSLTVLSSVSDVPVQSKEFSKKQSKADSHWRTNKSDEFCQNKITSASIRSKICKTENKSQRSKMESKMPGSVNVPTINMKMFNDCSLLERIIGDNGEKQEAFLATRRSQSEVQLTKRIDGSESRESSPILNSTHRKPPSGRNGSFLKQDRIKSSLVKPSLRSDKLVDRLLDQKPSELHVDSALGSRSCDRPVDSTTSSSTLRGFAYRGTDKETVSILFSQEGLETNPIFASKTRGSHQRSTSDLGLSTACRTSRTASLLRNPKLRQHLASTFNLNPDHVDFSDSVTKKLRSLSQGSDTPPSVDSPRSSTDVPTFLTPQSVLPRRSSEASIDRMSVQSKPVTKLHVPSFQEFRALKQNHKTKKELYSSADITNDDKSDNSSSTKDVSIKSLLTHAKSTPQLSSIADEPFACDAKTTKTTALDIKTRRESKVKERPNHQPQSARDGSNMRTSQQIPLSQDSTQDVSQSKTARSQNKSDISMVNNLDLTPARLTVDAAAVAMTTEEVLAFLDGLSSEEEEVEESSGPSTDHIPTDSQVLCDVCSSSLDLCSSSDSVLCPGCSRLRVQRREAILELVSSEVSYGRDLAVLRDEFQHPLQSMGMLSPTQCDAVFGNLTELIAINEQFVSQIQSAVDQARASNDQELSSVLIGRPFVEASTMLLAFDTYCSSHSPALLDSLANEKPVLRLYLEEASRSNPALRRMSLKTFLMAPVQRVMKYPLLLGRVAKATPSSHDDHVLLKKAIVGVEEILQHINSTKGTTHHSKRRLSLVTVAKRAVAAENIEISRAALCLLGWGRHEAYFLHSGSLSFCPSPEHSAQHKHSSNRLQTVCAVLVSLGRDVRHGGGDSPLLFPRDTSVQDAALVLFKQKAGRFQPIRDPFLLRQCVVSMTTSNAQMFEIQEVHKEQHLFMAASVEETRLWYNKLRQQAKDLGRWRHRRHALSNIMLLSNHASLNNNHT